MKEKRKSCPFCKSQHLNIVKFIRKKHNSNFVIFCMDCYARGPPSRYIQNTIQTWNMRGVQK